MKGKILFVVGLGVGYVLGTRAGRERYEQIKRAAENVWNAPSVQQGVGTVKDFAMTRVGDLSDTVVDNVKNLIGSATKGSGATKQDVSRAARSAKANISKAATAARSAVDDAADVASKSAASRSSTSGASSSGTSTGNGGSSTSRGPAKSGA